MYKRKVADFKYCSKPKAYNGNDSDNDNDSLVYVG